MVSVRLSVRHRFIVLDTSFEHKVIETVLLARISSTSDEEFDKLTNINGVLKHEFVRARTFVQETKMKGLCV